MNTTFQRAKKSDLEIIQTIAKHTVDQGYRYFLDAHTVDDYLSSGRLDRYLIKNFNNTWILKLDESIVGFAICIDNIIDFMLINFDHHRNGLGTKLLQHCENMLFEKHQTIALESFEENTKATKFYLANNWAIVEKYRDTKARAIKLIFRKKMYDSEEKQNQSTIHANPFR